MSTGNVDIHHSVYKYVVSLRAGFCVTVPNVGLMYVERNKCLSVQNDLGTNTSYIKVSYDNKAAYYSDSECKEFSRNVPYDFYACIQPELSINSFYFNNKMYVLTNRRDAPSAQLMTTNYLHPRCTFYYGRRIDSFVENGYVHGIVYENRDACTGIASISLTKCDVEQTSKLTPNPDYRLYDYCAPNVNTPNLCANYQKEGVCS